MRTRRHRSGRSNGSSPQHRPCSPPPLDRRLPQRAFLAPFEEPARDVPVLQAGEGFLRQGSEQDAGPTPSALRGHVAAARRLPWRRGGAAPAGSPGPPRAFRRPPGPAASAVPRPTLQSPFSLLFAYKIPSFHTSLLPSLPVSALGKLRLAIAALAKATAMCHDTKTKRPKLWIMNFERIRAAARFPGCRAIWE